MNIHCPHCQNAIEVVDSAKPHDVVCPSCGSSFNWSDLPTSPAEAQAPPIPRLGRLVLMEQLGQGAFGSVWRARDPELGVERAVKLARPDVMGSREAEERFLREARAAANLNHPGIVTVHDMGREDGSIYIVADLISGVNLAEWLTGQPDRRVESRRAAELIAEIADAVHFAHEHGVVHRDLKPSNVLIDDSGRVHITDFGLAKRDAAEIAITVEGRILGTPEYMSPEQARGQSLRVDGRTDVYSLGVMLYEFLAGERPFRGVQRMVLHQVLHDEPQSPLRLNNKIPRDLETVTLKCLAKDPAKRYATAGDLAADLRRWLGGEPILARPVGRPERLWRWAKRKPAVASLVGSIALLLLALAAGSVLFALQQRSAAGQMAAKNLELEQANQRERAAKQDADQKRIDAEKARDETKQAFDFLVAAFRKSDPSQDGETLTVAELFDQAANQLDTTFPNQPTIQAGLLDAIGQTYLGLGLFQKSVVVFERARDLRRNELGEDHEDTLTSMNNLAAAYESAGRLAEALPLFEQTLELSKAKRGPEHPDTLTSMNNLANAYKSAGRLAEALPLLEQTLELRKAKLGPEHPDTLTSMNNLASAYNSAGRLAEAFPLYEQTLELSRAKLGPEHPNTLISMNNLAGAYKSAGRLAEALPLFAQTLELMKAKLGPEHPGTLTSMNNLAVGYQSAGRLAEALPLYEQSLELTKAKLGLEHPDTLTSMNNLAVAYKSAGRLAEALPLLEQTLELLKAKLGPEHPTTLATMNSLALAYKSAARLAEALPLFEQTLELMKAKLGPQHPLTLQSMGNLANAYLVGEQPEKALPLFDRFIAGHHGRATPDNPGFAGLLAQVSIDLLQHRQYPAAETYLRECLTIREKKLPDDWVLFNTKSMLGGALAGQKKFQEAEPLLVEGYSGMKDREANIPPAAKTRLPEALERLVQLYDAWGKPDQAAEWRAKLPNDSKPPRKEPEAEKPPSPPSDETAKPRP